MNLNQSASDGTQTMTPATGQGVWAARGSLLLWPLLAMFGAVLVGAMLWLANAGADPEWAVVFEGRNYEPAMRRQAIAGLNRLGIENRLGENGEILVGPDNLATAQAALEKAGLKPTTLEEARGTSDGPLAILESPAQREEKRRAARERELAWHIRKFENVMQAHVTIEPGQGSHRWIGSQEKPKQRVRIYLETTHQRERLGEDVISRIEKLVLATLPTTAPGLVSIHDGQHVYRAAENGKTGGSGAENQVLEDRAAALAGRVRQEVEGLANTVVRVKLNQVDETPVLTARPVEKNAEPVETKLVLNEPISIEIGPEQSVEVAVSKPNQTVRAHIEVAGGQGMSQEAKRKAREQMVAILAPALLEEVDWRDSPADAAPIALANKPGTELKPDGIKTPEMKSEPPVRPLMENAQTLMTPWIAGGVALAVLLGGVVFWRVASGSGEPSAMDWNSTDDSRRWARDLAAAVTPPEPHLNGASRDQDASDTNENTNDVASAARVLSGWISAGEDESQA